QRRQGAHRRDVEVQRERAGGTVDQGRDRAVVVGRHEQPGAARQLYEAGEEVTAEDPRRLREVDQETVAAGGAGGRARRWAHGCRRRGCCARGRHASSTSAADPGPVAEPRPASVAESSSASATAPPWVRERRE